MSAVCKLHLVASLGIVDRHLLSFITDESTSPEGMVASPELPFFEIKSSEVMLTEISVGVADEARAQRSTFLIPASRLPRITNLYCTARVSLDRNL
ncbi:hypothetical protein E2C01_036095 [Portunus trituberculatus]|uniref:Uncharacterized protein n=1 Tax=Portunus trituberculatus TaxID=210409 RepID=A0A5B7FDA0_PORTR|nr:hypothetical protein [Portunus trituberculatus]